MSANKASNGTAIHTVSITTMRRFILGKHGLWSGRRWHGKAGAAQAIREMGGVQVDPVVALARNHDLELHSRVADYRPEHLHELAYKERQFFDYGGALHIYPIEELPYWKLHMQRQQRDRAQEYIEQNPTLLDNVRAELRTRGPLAQRDVEGTARLENYRARKDSGLALYHLWRTGELMTSTRRNFDRVYDFAENVAPPQYLKPASEAEAEAFFLRKALKMGTMPRLTEWRGSFAYFIQRPVTADDMKVRIAELIESGEVIAVKVEGKKDLHYASSIDLPLIETLESGEMPSAWTPLDTNTDTEVTFLSPLEPVSARGRAASLFNFEYKWEIYTPVEKRRWGYYVLPILYGNMLVARIDLKLERKARTLVVKGFWLEDPATGKDSAFAEALARGLIRLTRFHEATHLDAGGIREARLRAVRLFKDSGITLTTS